VVKNEKNELIPTRTDMGWRVCIDYRKLNDVTRKDHFPLPFIDQMLERLCGNMFYCFFDGFQVIFRSRLHPRIKRRPYSHAHMAHLLTGECPLDCVMLQLRFRGAW
jgi:hypothetical protein